MHSKIVWILMCTMVANSAYALIAPFLPIEFMAKGIAEANIGYVFAIYSVAVILCSPYVGHRIEQIGYTNMISLGIGLMGICFMMFGLVDYMEDPSLVFYYGLVLRFIQGFCHSAVQVSCYSVATNEFPKEKDKLVGYLEAMTCFGLFVGPIVGSMLYTMLGYSNAFYIYGVMLIISGFLIKYVFPIEAHDDHCEEDCEETGHMRDTLCEISPNTSIEELPEEIIGTPVTLLGLLSYPRFLLAALSSSLCYFTFSFIEPVLANRLMDFDLTTNQIGLFFGILPICSIPSCVLAQFVPAWVERRFLMIMASFASTIAFILAGPSLMFGFADSLLLMGIGQAVVGMVMPYLIIPSLPEMVHVSMDNFPGQERRINDLSSGIFTAFLGIGQVVAPAYGSYMTSAYGYRTTCDVVAVICLIYGVAYMVFGDGVGSIRDTCCAPSEAQEPLLMDQLKNPKL